MALVASRNSTRHPRLADGTAVPPEQLKGVFTALPGVGFPAYLPEVRRLDFGPDAERGIATTLLPAVGKPYPSSRRSTGMATS
jgi:hypothetical protein